MKREIRCTDCSKKLQASVKPVLFEHLKIVPGRSRKQCVCDDCCCRIQAGDPCDAISIWSDLGGIPYYEWEKDFLKETKNAKQLF